MNANVFFDMDGVIAKWNMNATIEDTFAEGYFDTGVEPEWSSINAIKKLYSAAEISDLYIAFLSARYDDESGYFQKYNRFEQDKKKFLDRIGLGFIPVHFVSCGETKRNVFREVPKKDINILFDDYSKNCFDWETEQSCIAIKWLNGINGNSGSFTGFSIPAYRMSSFALSQTVLAHIRVFGNSILSDYK